MKIVALTDSPQPSGFGRIANNVFERLARRGHQIHVCSLLWDGIFTEGDWFSVNNHDFPFRISGCGGRDIFQYTANVVNMAKPDVVLVMQDFPYAYNLYFNTNIDWSNIGLLNITPIDGYPIYDDWLQLTDELDATMVISEFGVEAMRNAGRRVTLCAPGVDAKFQPASESERKAIRLRAGIAEDSFVIGMMAMNQGRKDIPHTIEAFLDFAKDKPNARLYLDMDKASPAGWNIPSVMKALGAKQDLIIYKEDLMKRGVTELRDRYCMLDAHSVISHREGFGLPLIESQACGIPTIAMDWCAGTEVVGNNQGYLVKRNESTRKIGTWGNAFDYDPDMKDLTRVFNEIYSNPKQAAAIAENGRKFSIQRTWDKTADAVESVLNEVKAIVDARKRDSSNLQQLAPLNEVLQEPNAVPAKEPPPDNSSGRLLDGVQPEGAVRPSVHGSENG